MTPRYVVLDTSTDLVLEARFRGSYYSHEWVYNEDNPTFRTGHTSLFTTATRTNVGQTYTIPAGSDSLKVGYYGPDVLPTAHSNFDPTPENTVIVGSFGKCTITNSVAPLVKTLLVTHVIRVLVDQICKAVLVYAHTNGLPVLVPVISLSIVYSRLALCAHAHHQTMCC